MPQPTRGMIHVDKPLTNISEAFIQNADSFVADKVFPIVPVQKQSDLYFRYLKEDWFRDEAVQRAPGTESAGGMYEIETDTYFCHKYAFHRNITQEERANQDEPLNADNDSVEFITQKLLLRREAVWAGAYFTPGVWGTQLTGVDAGPGPNEILRWNVAGSTPIEDVSQAKMDIASVTGYRPNTLVLGANVYEALRNHDDILGRIVFTQRGLVNTEILASLFDVERIVVGWAVENSAIKGATEDTDFMLGNHALLTYSAPSPGLKQPTAGYIFAWTGLMGAGAYGNVIRRIQMPWLGEGTERIEGEMAFDVRRVADDLAVFFNGAVA